MLNKSTDDYGLPVTDPSLLRVANTSTNTQFLLQSELRAIQLGLKYEEIKVNERLTYKGYVEMDARKEGVGLEILPNGTNIYGEWHLNKLNGCGKVEFANGSTYLGELKNY
jgi:hypothetical protein